MYNEIDKLIEDIVSDYRRFVKNDETRVKEFQHSIEVNNGSKYIRIVANNSVWGFINKSNDNHKPWLPKCFVKNIEISIKEATEIIIAFLISLV